MTCCVPLGWTAPMPSMETSVALEVCQVSVADCPFSMVSGLTEMDAVGEAAGGGGGGGGGAGFLWQAPSTMTALRATTVATDFQVLSLISILFTFESSCELQKLLSSSDEVLFPTPVRLRVTSSKSQLMQFGTVSQHHPDFVFARSMGLKDDVAAVRRP